VRNDRERLLDVLEAIERIEKYAQRGKQEFENDELIQTWIVHHLQGIGEACRSLAAETRDRHPEVVGSQIIGMRHILVHNYFGIDHEVVWSVVENNLAGFKSQIEHMIESIFESR